MEMFVEVIRSGETGRRAVVRTVRLPLGRAAKVGRDPDATVRVLTTPSIDRWHCDLWWDGCCVWVEDRYSCSGVWLNGHQTRGREVVRLMDRVQVGCVILRLRASVRAEPSWLAWNDGTVPRIAQDIYDEWAFDRLPILADALEDAGCDNADILAHCRQAGEHVRGCWVVDLLLDKR
jgi:hypothetical protein